MSETEVRFLAPERACDAVRLLDAPTASGLDRGETVTWNFELTTPNMLMRQGWSRGSMRVGDTVTVPGWRARGDSRPRKKASALRRAGGFREPLTQLEVP
jgi:hypothetical protein